MAATIPAALKSADVQRFATRAAQLEKYKPIATYWLEYYVLQQILTRSLHTTSPEVGTYAVQLMDKLEQVKSDFATEQAITDDAIAKIYMEEFASSTFSRAEEAQNTDKVTRQTADTFQAAATFYDSLTIWGDLDAESKTKSKFAKFHALRIARALKEGKDPNETNPKVEPEPAIDQDVEDELKRMEAEAPGNSSALQPSVEDVDETTAAALRQPEPDVSPIDPSVSVSSRPVSVGGGYFPSAPTTTAVQPATVADLNTPHIDEETHIPRQATLDDMMSPSVDNDTHIPYAAPSVDEDLAARAAPAITQPISGPTPVFTQPVSTPITVAAPPVVAGSFRTDDDAVMDAQKHAKWAISALNFEDVPTAVRELRIALQSLGGL